jgi:hypothetical protein
MVKKKKIKNHRETRNPPHVLHPPPPLDLLDPLEVFRDNELDTDKEDAVRRLLLALLDKEDVHPIIPVLIACVLHLC